MALQWETGAEFDTYGFHILRSADGQRTTAITLTESIISSIGNSNRGATYRYTDSAIETDQRYTYWLQEVHMDGTTSDDGPFMAIDVSSLYLPLIESHP